MILFALDASRPFGERVAAALGAPLGAHEERRFEDGEIKIRPLVGVRGKDVFVVQSLHGDGSASAHDKLCQLLFFIATLRDHGAARATAVVPYLAYGRKDRQTKPRDPVTTRYLAMLFESVGTSAVVTLEAHNVVALQNAFRIPTVHLDTRRLFARRVAELFPQGALVVASPDPGGVKRAQLFRESLEGLLGRPVGACFIDKRRSEGLVSGNLVVGEVAGANVLVIDDLISTGGTMARAAEVCLREGARSVHALAAHGLFTGDAGSILSASPLDKILVSDTVPAFRLDPVLLRDRIEIVEAAPLFAQAIARFHGEGSLTELTEGL